VEVEEWLRLKEERKEWRRAEGMEQSEEWCIGVSRGWCGEWSGVEGGEAGPE